MSSPRRDFLSWLGASGVYAAAGVPLPARTPARGLIPVDDAWDMSWTDRVKGKHRAVFDSPQISDGAGLFRAILWQKDHATVYQTPASDITSVLVLRHEAIPLVMSDAYWATYGVGKSLKLKDDGTKKWRTTNPVASAAPGTPPQFVDYTLDKFIAGGNIVLACNLAFGGIVSNIQTHDKLPAADARKRALSLMVKGVILQPSGGFAVLRAQEAGCNYLFAS
jgi:hypothetical protein